MWRQRHRVARLYRSSSAILRTRSSACPNRDRNARQCTSQCVRQSTSSSAARSTEMRLSTIQKVSARLSTRRTVSTSGRGQGTIRCGHRYREHVRTILTTHVGMFKRKASSKFHTMTVRMFPSRCAMMFPPRSAEQLQNSSVLKFLTKTARIFHNSSASLYIRRCPKESAEEFLRRFVMTELAMAVILTLGLLVLRYALMLQRNKLNLRTVMRLILVAKLFFF